MYYFGVNLDTRFAVPDFWPQPETTHKIPFEREELKELAGRLKRERLEKRRRRLEREGHEQEQLGLMAGKENGEGGGRGDGDLDGDGVGRGEGEKGVGVGVGVEERGMFGVGSIERWARGRWRD